MHALHRLSIAAAICGAAAFPAAAATVGFSLNVASGGSLGGTIDRPGFTLTNNSDPGLTITSFDFTIGDTTFNFDAVTAIVAPSGGSISLTTGDTANGGVRTDGIGFGFGFSGFDPGESATWLAELDPDSVNGAVDFRTIFFNNGGPAIPNSVATVLFSDLRTLEVTLAATPGQTSYTFSASQTDADVPTPAALPLLAGAFGLLGLLRLRRMGAGAA